LDEKQRGELARLAASEPALLRQGQQELRLEPVGELRQRGAERRGRLGDRGGASVATSALTFGARLIPKIENRTASKEPAISLIIFHAVPQNYPDAYALHAALVVAARQPYRI
jgi:hypothetical protein